MSQQSITCILPQLAEYSVHLAFIARCATQFDPLHNLCMTLSNLVSKQKKLSEAKLSPL